MTFGLQEQRKHYDTIRQRFKSLRPPEKPVQIINSDVPVPVQIIKAPEIPPYRLIYLSSAFHTANQRASVRDIVWIVAKFYGVKVNDIMSARRTLDIVKPRHVAMYLCKELTLRSYPEIGRRIGNRDHTTALNAFRKITRLLETDSQLAAEIETLSEKVRELEETMRSAA